MSVPSDFCCFVTGATDPTCIGYAAAKGLLEAGAGMVTILGRSQDNVKSAVKGLSEYAKHGATVHGVVGDLKKPETMADLVKEAIEEKMEGKLNVLVVNGGNKDYEYLGRGFEDPAGYRMLHDVHVLSPLELSKAAYPYLLKAENGTAAVIMVTSASPQIPWPDTAPFNLAKAAENCLVETLAFKWRSDNIRVNAVLPGCIHTGGLDTMAGRKQWSVEEYAAYRARQIPLGRNGTPAEVGDAVVYLASPSSSFITGELLRLDGGLHLSNWFNQQILTSQYEGLQAAEKREAKERAEAEAAKTDPEKA